VAQAGGQGLDRREALGVLSGLARVTNGYGVLALGGRESTEELLRGRGSPGGSAAMDSLNTATEGPQP
jgi:hypothetical protein